MKEQPLQPAYILHSRPYRDSSLILELLTPEQGRIGCVARGARRDKHRRQQALQPFSPLLVSLLGRGELKTLGPVENAGASLWLKGRAVYAGLYANELLVRLLPPGEAQVPLFAAYQSLLQGLAALDGNQAVALEPPLRQFEWRLLQELGHCPQLSWCALSKERVVEGVYYRLQVDTGLVPVHREGALRAGEYSGAELLALEKALAAGDWNPSLLATAKRLNRSLLAPSLGEKPLASRELFTQVYPHDP